MNRTPSKPLAALWMAGWLALMLIVAVAGREAVRELNVFELMAIRSWIGLCLLYPLIWRAGGFSVVKTRRLPLHIARNTIHFGAQLGWFYALTLIPIGQVVAIEFTMPIWTAILAAMFLGERMTVWKVTAIVLGIIGVLIIVRPATGEVNPGQLIAISQLQLNAPTRESRGIRMGEFAKIREIIEEELEAAFDGTKPPKLALDNAADRGNALLRKFEAAHKIGVDPATPERTKRKAKK